MDDGEKPDFLLLEWEVTDKQGVKVRRTMLYWISLRHQYELIFDFIKA